MNDVRLSVFEAMDEAFQRTRLVLFSPFDFKKWLILGFCAFLAALAQGGGVGGFGGNPLRGGTASPRHQMEQASHWVTSHLPLVLVLGCFVLVFAVALGALFQWLGSRGQFMFLDGVVRNRAAVSEPWGRYRRLGNSLFLFRFLFGLAALAVLLILGGGFVLALLPSIRAGRLTGGGILLAVVGVMVFVPLILALALFQALLRDFVVPVMARRDLAAVPALRTLWREVLRGRLLEFVLYYLMSFVLGLAAAILITLGTCLTCCIAGLPYVSSVVFLPVFVFFRAFSLCFLKQVGPEWDLYAEVPPSGGAVPIPEPPPAQPEPAGFPGEAGPAPGAPPPDTVPGVEAPPEGTPGS